MASVFKRDDSPHYFAAYRGSRGERVQRTTKQTNRGDALRMAQEWEDLAKTGRNRTITEARARKVVADILEKATGEKMQFFTCRTWLDTYLRNKKTTTNKTAMIVKYEQTFRDFLEYLGERADLTVAAISVRDVTGFRDRLRKSGRAASTVNLAIKKTLSAPFNRAKDEGLIPINPCKVTDPLEDENGASKRDGFSTEQMGKILDAADNDWRGAILAGYTTGLRLRDISEMEWSAVDLDELIVTIRARKTGDDLVLPIHPLFAKWLAKQPRGIGKAKVFPELAGKGTGGRFGLSGRFAYLMESAGIHGRKLRTAKGKGRTTVSLTFHSLRHSFVSGLANAGVAQDVRQKLSGHADERVHQKYTHHQIEVFRAAVAKLPKIGGQEK